MNSTQQIGKCGELFVQYRLLQNGIESARMTTDSGIDLVAYSPRTKKAITIQVKSVKEPKPGGGKGKLALDWWLPKDSPAELVAFVDLSSERMWIFNVSKLGTYAQQLSAKGMYHFYAYVDDDVISTRKDGKSVLIKDFHSFLLENRMDELF